MAERNEGLPPTRPAAAHSEYKPQPDLRPGTTEESLYWVRSGGELRTGPWQDALETRAQVGGDPTFVPFSGSGPDAFGASQSHLEQVMFGEKLDTGYTGILRAIGGGMFTAVTSPITTITDEYQVGKIRELQQEFLKNHADALLELSEKMSTAKRLMRELSEQMGNAGLYPRKLSELMEKKRRTGNGTLESIEGAIERATDPAERSRLQALKDEHTKWMAERDARIAVEQGEVDELNGRLHGLDSEFYRQRGQLEKAGFSDSPRTETSGRDTDEFKVLSTTHTQPDAVVHASSLKDLLLNSKVGLDQLIAQRDND